MIYDQYGNVYFSQEEIQQVRRENQWANLIISSAISTLVSLCIYKFIAKSSR